MKEIISYGQFPIRELRPHKNKGMEITFIEKGIMEWMVEGRTEKINPGSVFFRLYPPFYRLVLRAIFLSVFLCQFS